MYDEKKGLRTLEDDRQAGAVRAVPAAAQRDGDRRHDRRVPRRSHPRRRDPCSERVVHGSLAGHDVLGADHARALTTARRCCRPMRSNGQRRSSTASAPDGSGSDERVGKDRVHRVQHALAPRLPPRSDDGGHPPEGVRPLRLRRLRVPGPTRTRGSAMAMVLNRVGGSPFGDTQMLRLGGAAIRAAKRRPAPTATARPAPGRSGRRFGDFRGLPSRHGSATMSPTGSSPPSRRRCGNGCGDYADDIVVWHTTTASSRPRSRTRVLDWLVRNTCVSTGRSRTRSTAGSSNSTTSTSSSRRRTADLPPASSRRCRRRITRIDEYIDSTAGAAFTDRLRDASGAGGPGGLGRRRRGVSPGFRRRRRRR